MNIIQYIYDHSPIFIQNIFVSLKGYLNKRIRYGVEYYNYLEFLREFDKLKFAEKQKFQIEQLRKFLFFVVKNSAFYAKLYKGIEIEKIDSLESLKRLPTVDKEMLRDNITEITTHPDEPIVTSHTGGTTGKSLEVTMTYSDYMRRMAMLDHFKERVGFIHLKMKRATFNGKHIVPPTQRKNVYWRYNRACKQMIYSSFHIIEDNLSYYVESLNRFRPQAIDGFFTSMCDVANYIERHHIPLTFTPVAIFPTSETLTAEGRALLERVFHCKVYDQYASSEGAPFVTEWPDRKLRMELASGVFEHVEGTNEILVTSFTTHGTPLIRYRIGDTMEWDTECFSDPISPIVHSIQGRRLDFLYTAEGAKINAGNVSNMLKYIPNAVIRAQFVQERIGEVVLLLEIDKQVYKPEYDELIRKEFIHKFGVSTNLFIKHVDSIPREKSGKFRMIKNSVQPYSPITT